MNAPCGTQVFGTDIGAVEFHMAPVNPILVSDLLHSFICKIPGVGDQTEGPIQAHRTDIIRVPVHHRAGRDAGAAGNTLRVQADGLAFLGRWLDLRGFDRRSSGDKVWFYLFQSVDQGLEVYRQVSDDRNMIQRFEGDGSESQIFNQGLTGKPFPPVDHQGAGAAHGKTATIPERKRFVLRLMDLEEGVEYGNLLVLFQVHEKLLLIRSRVFPWVETENLERVNHLSYQALIFLTHCPVTPSEGLSSKGQVIPNEKEPEGSKQKKEDKKDLLTLNAGSQVDQEYSYSHGCVKGHCEKQQELQRPAVGEKEMEHQK